MSDIPNLDEFKKYDNPPQDIVEVEVVQPSTGAGECAAPQSGPGTTVTSQLVSIPSLSEEKAKYLVEAQKAKEIEQAGIELARKQAIERIAKWAEKKKIFNGTKPPEEKQLNRIFKKLKKGLPIVKAIKGVCSMPTWNKWKQEFPEVAAMEEQANAEAIDRMLDKKEQLAANPGTHMGEIARDKVQMDELQNRIDRIDRLTDVRNNKNSGFAGNLMPIQINFGFGKK